MNAIDWQCIADAIRKGRFEDVTPEVWNQFADKIETFVPKTNKIKLSATKKREKGRPLAPKPPKWNKDLSSNDNAEKGFEYFNKMNEYKQNSKKTDVDKCCEYGLNAIEELYESFLKNNKYEVALEKVCKEMPFAVGPKTIEGLLTANRIDHKFQYEEAKAAEEDLKDHLPK